MFYEKLEELEKNSELKFKMYIDFDRTNRIFHHNFYFIEYKFVLKIALTPSLNYDDTVYDNDIKEIMDEDRVDLKLEKFNLANYIYLLHYG